MEEELLEIVKRSVDHFIRWLEDYGETSWDHQSFFSSPLGRAAKALYYKRPMIGRLAVAPMIFCEAFWPSARRLFWVRQRFPIADAHYAMGFSYLFRIRREREYYEKALHFLDVLQKTRCPNYENFCWGYPFDWVTRTGTIVSGTPLITTTPYVFEAFQAVYEIDKDPRWREIMHSIAEHAIEDIKDFSISPDASTCSYTPYDRGGVVNASAYRAFLLTNSYVQFSEDRYWKIAERNINYVLQSQKEDGSWYYAFDAERDFIDHFHTCFVLKALGKIDQLIGHEGCKKAIKKGISYYINNLFDRNGLPKPFSRAPRLTVYRQELYDYAECINLCVALGEQFEELDLILHKTVNDLMGRWRKGNGAFCSRKLLVGWDEVPMHRWAQAQLFRSLCFLLYEEKQHS